MAFSNLELELAKSLDRDVYEALCKYREIRGFGTVREAHAHLMRTVLFGICGQPPANLLGDE